MLLKFAFDFLPIRNTDFRSQKSLKNRLKIHAIVTGYLRVSIRREMKI